MPQNGNTMDKINVSSEKVSSELAIFLFREDDNFIAYSPALDLSGYGKTEEYARNSFNIVLKEYFDYAINEGTLYEDLKSHANSSYYSSNPYFSRTRVHRKEHTSKSWHNKDTIL